MQSNDPRPATFTIRNIDVALKARLRVRAARNGRSMEAELRQILSDTLIADREPQPNLAEAIQARFAALGGLDLEPHPPVALPSPPSFE